MNKTKFRGVVYSFISVCGLSYELIFVEPPRVFLIVMYGLVIVIGVLYFYKMPDH